jgi:hypothetical protein
MDDAPLPLPPPRQIPRQLRWRTYLGGSAMTVGWGFLAAASLVFWSDGGREGIYSLVHLGGEVARAEARIVSKLETGSKSDSRSVYAYRYAFEADGHARQGAIATHRAAWQVDERIPVDYARDDPARSLPADLPRRPTPISALLAAIALLTMGLGIVPARNALDRLRHAPAARAADDERDGDDSDDRWLAFDADGQRRRVRTQLAVRKHPRPIVLYRREIPGDGVAMLDLPGAPDTGGRGELREDPVVLARYLLLPVIVAAYNVHSFWAAVR